MSNSALTANQRYVLSLIRKSLLGDTEDITLESLEEVEKIIVQSGILLTVYKVLPEELKCRLRTKYDLAIRQSILQEYECEQILQAFSKDGLNCIALKGWELKKLYPTPKMRQMADLDILVSPYDYKQIKSDMESLEFKGKNESSWKHDSFHKNEVTVEVHKRLTDDSSVIQAWEREMWERATEGEIPHVFLMSPEDFYIFHIIHLYKDFMNGSLGLRRIVDTWLLQKQPMDMSVVRDHLDQFGMLLFQENMVILSKATMGEIKIDENSEILLQHAFTHGIYGTDQSYKAGRIAAMSENSIRSGKVHSAVAAVFLPYKRMKAHFPELEKYPILLPYYWMKRIFRFLSGDISKYRAKLNYHNISEADYEEMKRFFKAGGVTEQ